MTKPTFYPEWATLDTTLPAAGTGNKERPQEILRTVGFDKGQVATAQEFNWMFDNVHDWIVHLDTTNTTNKTFTLTGDVTGSATYNNEAGWSVTTTVVDNSHNHVSANISDATENDNPNTIVKRNSHGDFAAVMIYSDVTGGFFGNLTGNADTATNATNATLAANATNAYACSGNSATATKLQTSRNIALTGDVTGNANFDGSGNISISTTAAAQNVITQLWSGSAISASVDISSHTNKELIISVVDSNIVVFKNIPTSFLFNVKTSGQIYIDYGDAGDFAFDYSLSGGTLSLTSLQRGNFVSIYVR